MKTKVALAVASALAGFIGVSTAAQAAPFSALAKVQRSFKEQKQFKTGELVLGFSADATEDQRKSILKRLGVDKPGKALTKNKQSETIWLVQLKGISVQDAVKLLAGVPTVAVAEPNWILKKQVANDPLVAQDMWNLYGPFGPNNTNDLTVNDFGTDAISTFRAAENGPNCSNVVIGMLDTGLYANHGDLLGNVYSNPKEIPGNNADDDNNGYADDVNGYNFVNGNATVNAEDAHGTHVAGIMVAVGGNNTGISGVCQGGKIVTAKVIDPQTGLGTSAAAIAAVDYLTNLKLSGTANVVAVNNSWGGIGYSKALEDAYARAGAANIVHVVSAGNEGNNNDAGGSYPALYRLPNVISVASIDSNGNLGASSNFGASTVDIAAPGVGILSTSPAGVDAYEYQTGTSQAAPHVTAAAALYVSMFPNASVADIKSALFDTARANPALAGKVAVGGQLSVSSFAQKPPTQPYVPPTNQEPEGPPPTPTDGEGGGGTTDVNVPPPPTDGGTGGTGDGTGGTGGGTDPVTPPPVTPEPPTGGDGGGTTQPPVTPEEPPVTPEEPPVVPEEPPVVPEEPPVTPPVLPPAPDKPTKPAKPKLPTITVPGLKITLDVDVTAKPGDVGTAVKGTVTANDSQVIGADVKSRVSASPAKPVAPKKPTDPTSPSNPGTGTDSGSGGGSTTTPTNPTTPSQPNGDVRNEQPKPVKEDKPKSEKEDKPKSNNGKDEQAKANNKTDQDTKTVKGNSSNSGRKN